MRQRPLVCQEQPCDQTNNPWFINATLSMCMFKLRDVGILFGCLSLMFRIFACQLKLKELPITFRNSMKIAQMCLDFLLI